MKTRVNKWWPIGFIFFAWLIFSFPYFFKGLVPFPSRYLVTFFPPWNAAYGMPVKNNAMPDVITQIYPWKHLTIDAWKHGEIPLWNPYSFAGTTHLGNYQSAPLSPFNLLFFVLPEIDAWSILILLQPLLAALCTYIFLRALNRSQIGSLIGSLAFMFCGFLVVWMAYGTLGYAALWLPLILYGLHQYSKTRSWWYGLIASVSLTFSFLSGHFQISMYVAAVSFFYALLVGWKSSWFLLLGLFLSAPQILPALTAYQNSVRSELFAKGGEIIPWQYLMTIVAPDFFGNPVTRNDWFGHYAEWASFIGVIPLVFALYAIIQKKVKQEMFFLITAVVSLFLALPTPLTSLLFALKIPALSTSAAARIIVLTSFSLCVLASFGLDKLVHDWKAKRKSYIKLLSSIVAVFLFVSWIMLLVFKPLDVDKLIVAKRNFILPSALLVGTLVALWGGMFFKGKWKTLILALLIGLTSFDMLRFATKWMPFEERQFVYPQMAVISFLKERVGNSRVFGNFGNELATYFGISNLEGYDAVYQRRYGEFISTLHDGNIGDLARSVVLVDKQGKFTEEVLQLLGVRFILHRIGDGRNIWAYPFWNYAHYNQMYKDEWFEVLENTKALPRAFLASKYIVAKNDQEIITKLFNPTIDRRQTIILEEEPSLAPQEGKGEATIDEYRPTRVKLSVKSDAPKLLFLSDTYDPGWKVTIDGQAVRVLRADYDFRAVAVPGGVHIVEFRYHPQSFRIGLIAAFFSIALLIWGSIRQLRYAHRIL